MILKMEKKLTAQGPRDRKSYTVTLPIEWIKKQGLDKGKVVELEVVGRKIVVSPGRDLEERELVDLKMYPQTLIKVLQGLYRLGVNEIKLFYAVPDTLTEINEIINTKLIGYEVIEQKKDYVVIKDITKESSEDFDTVLRRIFLLLLELVETGEQSQLISLDKNIKKLINYCQRILIKRGHSDYRRTPFYYVLLHELEKIGDEYVWLLSLRQKGGNATLRQINTCMRKAYRLYYKFDEAEYDEYEYLTYNIKHRMKSRPKLSVMDMHLHNLARQLNTIYGTIFVLKYKQKLP